jgi:hypothetical protein
MTELSTKDADDTSNRGKITPPREEVLCSSIAELLTLQGQVLTQKAQKVLTLQGIYQAYNQRLPMSKKSLTIGRLMSLKNRPSLLKKSTDEFLRIQTSMFCCQFTANWPHIHEFPDVFLLRKALQ